MKKSTGLAILLGCFCSLMSVSQDVKKANKTIDSLIYICRTSNRPSEDKLQLALEAQTIANQLEIDSIQVKAWRTLALMYINNDDLDSFVKINRKYVELATKIKDSFSISAGSANLGSYHRYIQQNDSAFYYLNNALKYYKLNENTFGKAQTLYWIADVQHVVKIYEGAETDAIRALRILEKVEQNNEALDLSWGIYNLLAIISSDLGDFDQALIYYLESLEYSKKIEDAEINEVFTLNNIANTYRKNKEFNRALEIFNDLVKKRDVYEEFEPSFYGNLLNNIALTKIDKGEYEFEAVELQLKEARDIAYEYEDDNGKVMTTLDLSRLYLENNRSDSVRKYANLALKLANDFSSNEAKQRALYLLSEVTSGEAGKNYLREHIRLGDSLAAEERLVRNKIARIKFDTDQLQAKNEQMSKENFYLLVLSIVLLLTGILVYVIISQRARNKELRLQQAQQEANEEIYNLMLNQQDKIDEARSTEKIRVSKELHDGVLGRLFGVRLSLDSLNFSEGKEAMTNRGNYINQLKGIEEDIRKISHEMNADFVGGAGFTDILSELVETQATAYDLKFEFNCSDDINWENLSNKVKINLYRIVQESMQNIYKHAQATTISVAILLINNDICLEVTDDGQGFDVNKQRRGIGLKNMSSRVNEVNGTVKFQSKIGDGTTVSVLIPGDQL